MRTETKEADITISIWVECPKCDADIDLMEIEPLLEDGEIHRKALGEELGGDDLELDYKCPGCGEKLRTNTVCW